MDAFQPFVAPNGLGVNISSARALIEGYKRELSEVEALITRVEDDRREDERVLRSNNEAMRLQSQHQIDDLRAQESVEVEQLEAASQARRAPLDEKRTSILTKIDTFKESMAHIQNVPVEVLGAIFREVVALDVAPWLLTTVNKSWRRAAMTNPWLWSNIRLGGLDRGRRKNQSEWLVDGISRICCGKGLACRNLGELAYFEGKSGVVPLDVGVYRSVREDEWEVIWRLFGPHLSSRIRSLSIFLDMDRKPPTEWILGPLPLLQQLFYINRPRPLVELIMAQAHQLKNLTAHRLPSNMLKYPFWTTLRTLNLGFGANGDKLNQAISELRLIHFIEGLPNRWPNAETPVATLEHIKSINLRCELKHLARLRLPQLEKLVWSQSRFHSFSVTDPDWSLSLPNLGEIEADARGEAFAVVLRELPNVHTALLRPIHFGIFKDPWALDLIQSLTGAEDMLCPKLRHLTLDNQSDKTLAEPLTQRLITSRKALGIPFTHVEIVWASRSGEDEEVVQYA